MTAPVAAETPVRNPRTPAEIDAFEVKWTVQPIPLSLLGAEHDAVRALVFAREGEDTAPAVRRYCARLRGKARSS